MAVKIQTIKDIRIYLSKDLKGIYKEPELRIIADVLIRQATGITSLHQLYDNNYVLKQNEADKITGFSTGLKNGKPLQYVVGETTFYSCTIRLNSSVLIPRPETEELADLIIKENKTFKGNIIDIGTGSGCIAVALAVNLPLAAVTGIDVSAEAVKIAEENALLNNVKVKFLKDDLFNISKRYPGAGIIVSNPPYIMNSEKVLMNRNVLDFEPPIALFVPDSEPLIYYRSILEFAVKALLPGGRLYLEINEMMGNALVQLLESSEYSEIEVIKDINEKDRIIKARKNA